ncbi:unnamed protein product [Caenorhabditis auriculariae]|uniref:Uncharacterized protein n=1 Tax=Caenorhabditis auriculariae TaxID=2777116 RepID=A0A8S1GMJ2_9PELO|nr:unnamed protein product [Caenorhabditis auriculariae]
MSDGRAVSTQAVHLDSKSELRQKKKKKKKKTSRTDSNRYCRNQLSEGRPEGQKTTAGDRRCFQKTMARNREEL